MRTYYCPANSWDCPYWNKNGTCQMGEMNLDPFYECDDFAAFWDADDEYWEDEEDVF